MAADVEGYSRLMGRDEHAVAVVVAAGEEARSRRRAQGGGVEVREADAAGVRERPPCRGGQLDDVVGEKGVHQARPTVERPTIMRWISMVPEATVAACAYR